MMALRLRVSPDAVWQIPAHKVATSSNISKDRRRILALQLAGLNVQAL
jgi:hypothetical protein